MHVKTFRFGRLSSRQFKEREDELEAFLQTVQVVDVPQVTANDEEGTVMFVFYDDKPNIKPATPSKKASDEKNS